MRYLIKQLWPLVLLLVVSIGAVIWAPTDAWYYQPLREFFLFACYVMIVGSLLGFAGRFVPRRFRWDKAPFAPCKWEREGRIYRDRLHIERWKDKLTDMSKATDKVASKAVGGATDSASLMASIQEMCVAEATHGVIILLSPLMFLLLRRWYGVALWAAYVAANLLDIIIMRYNRPRVVRLYRRATEREARQ